MHRTPLIVFVLIALFTSACAPGALDQDLSLDDLMPEFPLSEPEYTNKRMRDFGAFEAALAAFPAARAQALDSALTNATIPEIQALLDAGDLTSVELVTYYVDRIRRYDIDQLNSVMELNPDALADAAAADELRAAGTVLGPMHGIPVLLKDNIAAIGMHATAGAYALKDWQPQRDAFLVQQLRGAGAVILGKANLSEWANYMDPGMPNGFSVLGGQTRHPYGPFDPLGSSSGSAVAAAANLATVTVGSETQGSIVSPSKVNSVVGLKTSHGLVSGDYIIPLVDWMDVAGPIGRTVTDVAILLSAMTALDAAGEADAALGAAQALDYSQYASLAAANSLTVALPIADEAVLDQQLALLEELEVDITDGLRESIVEELDARTAQIRAIGERLNEAGLNTVEISAALLPEPAPVLTILEFGFQDSLNRFAADIDGFPVETLADVAAFNAEDLANRAPYGQSFVEGSANTEQEPAAYVELKAAARQQAAESLRAMLTESGADVLLISDLTSDLTQEYASAGFPAITLPVGYGEDGMPIGLLLTADYLGEPKLIAAAYAIEQATMAREAPDLDAILETFEGLTLATPTVE